MAASSASWTRTPATALLAALPPERAAALSRAVAAATDKERREGSHGREKIGDNKANGTVAGKNPWTLSDGRSSAPLDTSDLNEAVRTIRLLKDHVRGFKVGHALTLTHGLPVLARLRDAGADRVFLDLKFHDIPNAVGLAVREAARYGAWMVTVHTAGGPAMMAAAAASARAFSEEERPCVLGVSVLTSLDQHTLTDHLGVDRTIEEHMVYLSHLAVDCDLDGVVCSAHEVRAVRLAVGPRGVVVTPGIRLAAGEVHDQKRVGDARAALGDGADYLVVGRAPHRHRRPRRHPGAHGRRPRLGDARTLVGGMLAERDEWPEPTHRVGKADVRGAGA